MKPSETSHELRDMINSAIQDGVITRAEYDKIIMKADEDCVIDPEERALLASLNDMIASGAVKRTA